MKILIVDDAPQRYDRLVTALDVIGIGREKIDIVTCANDARDRLAVNAYDLLILDVLLPLWPESASDVQHSMDLLFQIREGEIENVPRYVVGITADLDVAGKALAQFEDWTWSVLNFAEDNDEWVVRAANCAKFARDQHTDAAPEPAARVDLAIVCALSEPEEAELLKLPWNWSPPRPINDLVFVRDGYVELDGRKVTVCVTTAPRMGMVSTALRSAAVITTLQPRLLAMTGICAGVRGKVNLGEVLFADPAWDFQSGKRVKDKENTQFSIRPHHLPAPALIRSHIDQIRADKEALLKLTADYPENASGIIKVVPGPVASGSAVLADGEVIKEIRAQHGELIGVEMEIYGLYAAAQMASNPQPLCFALKGVCDFADPDKADDAQQFAAYASARVLQLLIERYGKRLIA
ncbi:hypothetical protein [Tsuneonella suprasediminis]|uniref:5'-methylthioadenosine/S-adenosylhomocysteine nucleosidase family protein n=1 Tax=Tsuneonella suprasediminis TaxID=2306996 RepID=UPI002F921370